MLGPRKPYSQRLRANATAALRGRILDALFQLVTAKDYDRVTLDEVSELAGTTRQTVLRFFGSKDGALTALLYRTRDSARDRELRAAGHDLALLAKAMISDHENVGDFVFQLLRQEGNIPAIAERFAEMRRQHLDLLREKLQPILARMAVHEAEVALLQVRAVTDTLFWRVMRHDMAMDPGRAELLLLDLLRKILAPAGDGGHAGADGRPRLPAALPQQHHSGDDT